MIVLLYFLLLALAALFLISNNFNNNNNVRRAMGGIQSWYLTIFAAYLMHYTYMSRFSQTLRKAAFVVAVSCVAFPLGIFIPIRAPTAGGDVAAGIFMMWTVLGTSEMAADPA